MFSPTPEAEIRTKIYKQGKITFKEFMAIALYHPHGGYYTSTKPFGSTGDYYTSPAVHPAFGALLAIQLHRMWELLDKPNPFFAVEMGAGNGILARDVMDFTASRLSSDFVNALEYIALERYPSHADPHNMRSIQRIKADGMPLRNVTGCLLSNELLDAFPVHRFKKEGGEILEVYVTVDSDGNLSESLYEPSTPDLRESLKEYEGNLPEGYEGEANLDISPWIQEVSEALNRGFVITIDYGYPRSELYRPDRLYGTFQTYYMHTEGTNPYQRIGRQDMTAHVDLTMLEAEGILVDLKTLGLATQSEFLRLLGWERFLAKIREANLSQKERQANIMALHELVKTDGLGGFKVSIQEKDTGVMSFEELIPSHPILDFKEAPLLSNHHMPLLEGRYPHLAEFQLESLWPFDEDSCT